MASIHATAIVEPGAELAGDVEVGAYSIVRAKVRIGAGSVVGPHCVIEGKTTIGRNNRIWQFNSIGAMPQDMSHGDEITELVIGDRNTIREYCTFNTGTRKEEGITRVGDDNWIMAYCHLAHDVRLGSRTVLANGASLAGHVHVDDWAVIGGLSGVHQFTHVGAHAMIGFQSHVAQDVPPYFTAEGHPLALRALNLTGLKRRSFSAERIATIKEMHRSLYRKGLTLERSLQEIEAMRTGDPAADVDVETMLEFLARSTRGIVR